MCLHYCSSTKVVKSLYLPGKLPNKVAASTHNDSKPKCRRPSKLLLVLTAVYAAALLLAPYLPTANLIHALLCYAPPQLLAIPLVISVVISFVLWARRRNRSLQALTIAVSLITLPFLYSFEINLTKPEHGGANLRVMTCNIFFDSRQVPELAEYISKEKIDMLLLQENKGDHESPAAYLHKKFPTFHLFMDGSTAILSRWPLSETRSIPHRSLHYRRILTAKVNSPVPFRVANMHWTVPQVSRSLRSFRHSIPQQISDCNQLVEILSNEKLPLVFGGDFNNPPRHGLTRLLRKKYTNAFSTVGFGPGLTYSSKTPLIRIDHLYSNEKVVPVRCSVGPSFGSDHRSLIADFEVLR